MSLILDAAALGRSKLLELIEEQRQGLEESIQNLEHWPARIRDPASFRTARELLTDVLALSRSVVGDEAISVELLASVANVQYGALIASIDLMKSHSDLPSTVPRARR